MTEDKITEIMVRLERLDAGQRYVIEQLGELRAASVIARSATALHGERLNKVEWAQGEHERRQKPWRQLAFTVVASVAAAIVTFLILHHT